MDKKKRGGGGGGSTDFLSKFKIAFIWILRFQNGERERERERERS